MQAYTLNPNSSVTLAANTTYWIVVAPSTFNFVLWRRTTDGNLAGPGSIPDLQAFSTTAGLGPTDPNVQVPRGTVGIITQQSTADFDDFLAYQP